MSYLQIAILGLIQGLAELLPVSSSAHVIVAEKLMGLDPSAPDMTFLLVMLHTGTMFAVIAYFWPRWRPLLLGGETQGSLDRTTFVKSLIIATALTGVIGLALKAFIEHVILAGEGKAEVEELFRNLPLMAASLAAAGVIIIISGRAAAKTPGAAPLSTKSSILIGAIQGLCLPFRGFSRSGATISTGLLTKLPRDVAETFSFALAVLLTPAAIFLEAHRLMKAGADGAGAFHLSMAVFAPGIVGMICSMIAGLGALRWLSKWLENGKWHYFGYYCLAAAVAVLGVNYLQ